MARFAATALLDSEAGFSPLLIYGPPGVGKTHLALGYAGLWKERHPSQAVSISDGADFARDVSVARDTRGLPDFRRRMSRYDLIVIDDVDALSPKEAAQAELVRLLDDADRRQQSMIVTARQMPSANGGLLPALCSRLLAGLTLPVRPPESAAREALVSRFAEDHGCPLSSRQVAEVADAFPLAPGPLADAVTRLIGSRSSDNAAMDSQLITSYQRRWRNAQAPSLATIATAVGRQFGFRVAELKGPSRRQAVSRARGMAMYLARQMTSHSTAAIGRHFGSRDHTTVMHACQVTQQRLDTDPALRQAAEHITRRLGGDGTDTPV